MHTFAWHEVERCKYCSILHQRHFRCQYVIPENIFLPWKVKRSMTQQMRITLKPVTLKIFCIQIWLKVFFQRFIFTTWYWQNENEEHNCSTKSVDGGTHNYLVIHMNSLKGGFYKRFCLIHVLQCKYFITIRSDKEVLTWWLVYWDGYQQHLLGGRMWKEEEPIEFRCSSGYRGRFRNFYLKWRFAFIYRLAQNEWIRSKKDIMWWITL